MAADRRLHRRAGYGEKTCGLSDAQFRVWVQYILSADDFGILPMTAVAIQSGSNALEARPLRAIVACLEALVTVGLVNRFEHQGRPYLFQWDWQDWQKIAWPAKTLHPCPPVERLSADTRWLFQVFPGGRKVPKKPDESTSEVLRPTREVHNTNQNSNSSEGCAGGGEPLDVVFTRFRDGYPENRRTGGYGSQTAFLDAAAAAGGYGALFVALENHLASEQWADKALIPNMRNWLVEERWRQVLPARKRRPNDVPRSAGWTCLHVAGKCQNRAICEARALDPARYPVRTLEEELERQRQADDAAFQQATRQGATTP